VIKKGRPATLGRITRLAPSRRRPAPYRGARPFDPRILDLRGVIFGVTLILKEAKKGRLTIAAGSEWGDY